MRNSLIKTFTPCLYMDKYIMYKYEYQLFYKKREEFLLL